MKSLILRDFVLRKRLVASFEKQFPYKVIYKNQILSKKVRYFAFLKFVNLSKGRFKTKVRNTCIYTSRARGIFSKLRISRLEFKRKVNQGFLPNWYKIK